MTSYSKGYMHQEVFTSFFKLHELHKVKIIRYFKHNQWLLEAYIVSWKENSKRPKQYEIHFIDFEQGQIMIVDQGPNAVMVSTFKMTKIKGI